MLDAGCGTGSITPALARQEHGGIAHLTFEAGDLLTLASREQFDIVTAARLIQWIGEPVQAIRSMGDLHQSWRGGGGAGLQSRA